MGKYSYLHEFNCQQCGKATIRKTREKEPQKFCSRSCSVEFTKVPEEIKWERAVEAYNKQVIKKDGCWGWNGYLSKKGYAIISGSGKNGLRNAHRISFMINKGQIPKGLHVLHSCNYPKCTNPDHLRLGTNKENIFDKIKSNRQNSKLTIYQVKEIKLLLLENKLMHKEIAEKYGVKRESITSIKSGKSWNHVNI